MKSPGLLIFERDEMTCVYCEKTHAKLHMDHVFPVSRCNHTFAGNLVTACRPCNLLKSPLSRSSSRGCLSGPPGI